MHERFSIDPAICHGNRAGRALKEVKQQRPDVVIADRNLPKMPGPCCILELKQILNKLDPSNHTQDAGTCCFRAYSFSE